MSPPVLVGGPCLVAVAVLLLVPVALSGVSSCICPGLDGVGFGRHLSLFPARLSKLGIV
jgi:hypothetical protein